MGGGVEGTGGGVKNLTDMNKFCDWLSEAKVFSVHDSFF